MKAYSVKALLGQRKYMREYIKGIVKYGRVLSLQQVSPKELSKEYERAMSALDFRSNIDGDWHNCPVTGQVYIPKDNPLVASTFGKDLAELDDFIKAGEDMAILRSAFGQYVEEDIKNVPITRLRRFVLNKILSK